jgi:hypothetical protein
VLGDLASVLPRRVLLVAADWWRHDGRGGRESNPLDTSRAVCIPSGEQFDLALEARRGGKPAVSSQ